MKAVEVNGTVDEHGRLRLDEPLSSDLTGRVRVILLSGDYGDVDEREWLRQAAVNPAFEFLNDPAEDIYSLSDGKPFGNKG